VEHLFLIAEVFDFHHSRLRTFESLTVWQSWHEGTTTAGRVLLFDPACGQVVDWVALGRPAPP